MATHTQLPIYKVAYDLLGIIAGLVKNMHRDYKRSIGDKISTKCIEITVLIFRANVAQDKAPHLLELIERLQVAELMLRQTTHSHHDRARLANTLRQRGHSVKADFTKTYRKSA